MLGLRKRAEKAIGLVGLAIAAVAVVAMRQGTARTTEASAAQAPVRILVFYDMEGASGVVSDATMDRAQRDSFAVGRLSVIDDVAAVVAGLFDGGATQVDVEGSHGGFGDTTLVPRAHLDPRAGMLYGSQALHPYALGPNPLQPGYERPVARPPYDAVVTVAMHDKPMSGGFSPHVLGMGISPIFEGRAVTETELIGYNFGAVGIPVIFGSGDDRLRTTLATAMPWVEYAVVKRVTSPTVVAPLPPAQTRQVLREGAAEAVRALRQPNRFRLLTLPPTFRAGLLPSYPLLLPPGMGNLPTFERRGDTVTFAATDYRAAYWGMFVLQRIARAFSVERAFSEVAQSRDSAVVNRVMDSLVTRAAAFEAGRWRP